MIRLTPTLEAFETLRKTIPPGPVVMINLLKFRPDGGRETYAKYMSIAFDAVPPSPRLPYSGKAGPDLAAGEDWDFVVIVEYPSFAMVVDAFCHPDYQRNAAPLRAAALEHTLCMVSFPTDVSKMLE